MCSHYVVLNNKKYACRYESLIPGKPELVAEYKGKLFCFSTEANQEKFLRYSNREMTMRICGYKTKCLHSHNAYMYIYWVYVSVSDLQIMLYVLPFTSLVNMYSLNLDVYIS